MISALTNHLWQSTLFAMAAGLLTLAFCNNHAKVRFWFWLSEPVHIDSKQVPVYAPSIAKGGAKLQPTMAGSCVPVDTSLSPPYPQFCGQPKRGDPRLHLIGTTMSDLCKTLSVPEISDRPVIDKTGLSGMFDIQLPTIGELRGAPGGVVRETRGEPGGITAVDPAPPGDSPFDGLRAAVEKLGLNLTPTKGSGKLLVIDHIEGPTEN